jgi:hypothetical protein
LRLSGRPSGKRCWVASRRNGVSVPVDVRRIVAELQSVAVDCLEDKLRIAGFTLSPHVSEIEPEIEQACRTCMYYESHRKYCNLPELKLGVEPEWSCILWRV